jgi:predicted metal-binding protein
MARIGILSCSNSTQETNCCMCVCLKDLRQRKGFFERYPANEPLDLVGVINCAGCPTNAVPQKILKKVRALASFKLDALHLTYCMTALCPFQNAYRNIISEAYPDLEIIAGTHTPIDNNEFKRAMQELLCPTLVRPMAMTDLMKGNLKVPGKPLKF